MHKNPVLNPEKAFLQTAPVQYVCRDGIIDECGTYISPWGKRALISGGTRALRAVRKKLTDSLNGFHIDWTIHQFMGECCDSNINEIKQKAQEIKADMIIGVGGGKSLDTAKGAAELCDLPIVCIPTIAATCAATTAQSVVYNEKGVFEKVIFLSTNPQLVLVEPAIIAHAPGIYLQAGILDSLAKWYEGKAVFRGIKNPDVMTSSAMHLAHLLNEEMQKKADRALELVREKKVRNPLRDVVI